MSKKLDLPELKTRFDLLYFQLQVLEQTIEVEQKKINETFGLPTEKYNSEKTKLVNSLKYFCDENFIVNVNAMKLVVRKIKNLIK